jgi:cation diffusion facilitator family transporter
MDEATLAEDRRKAERVALVSLLAAMGLVIAKLVAGFASGSLAILSEAAHSGLDAAATGLALFAVRLASRPPDIEHPYGHGKAENIFALLETAALFILSLFIAREALLRLGRGTEVDATWYGFAVILLSIAVDFSRARVLTRAGRRYRSPALEADALHFTADLLTSTVVLIGLLLVAFGYSAADAWGGLVVAAVVAFSSIRLGRRSVDVLMDRAPTEAVERITHAAASVEGVTEVRRVRARYVGGQPQADVVIGISRTIPLEKAHQVTEEVERTIRRIEPGADVVVHVEPLADERAIAERVISIAAREAQVREVHNVYVTLRPEGLHITLHAKFPASMPLGEAHAVAERLEAEIAREIGRLARVARVDTHLEPLEAFESLGADATDQQSAFVKWASTLAEQQPEVKDCHEVVVTETDGALSVVMHCAAAPGLSIDSVHKASTRIENEIHRRWPEIERVTVHFEPAESS